MNEKIKQLAIEAQNNGDSIHYYDPVFVEKFAELIVKECADYAEYLDLPGYKAKMLKKHFGVEE